MNKEKRNQRSKEKIKKRRQSIYYKKISFFMNIIKKGSVELEKLIREVDELLNKECNTEEEKKEKEILIGQKQNSILRLKNFLNEAENNIKKVKNSLSK